MKSRFLTLILASVFFLSACGSKEEETDSAKDGKKETDSELTTTSNQLSRDYYRALIQDGAYKTSKSRGITQKLNSTFNLKAFETGLIQLSQEKFESDVYYFQEGQYLDSKTINQWLGRFNPKKGDDQNLEGLNPKNNGKQEPDQRAPIYLNSILEQDYIKKDKEEYKTS
ncbi:MAG: CamS family sex pheromone protein, partial [Pisciglobus halotolerans]|nr:CamS family sex pheromone protein [Pisciglobus halotolerans]